MAGFALIGVGTGAIVPCGFALAARQTAARPAVGLSSASLFSTLTRLPAPLATGAIAQSFSLPLAFAAFAVALAAASVGMAALASAGRARAGGEKCVEGGVVQAGAQSSGTRPRRNGARR